MIGLVIVFVLVIVGATTSGIKIKQHVQMESEEGEGSPDKEEFQISVRNIKHDDLLVSVTIDGLTKKEKIDGNPSYIDAPTVQVVRFRFDRHEDAVIWAFYLLNSVMNIPHVPQSTAIRAKRHVLDQLSTRLLHHRPKTCT